MSTAPPLLSIRDLTISYVAGDGAASVRGVGFDVNAGEAVALVGESGSGKSTICHAVLGLLPRSARSEGSIRFDGSDLLTLSRRDWQEVRGVSIGFVPQDPSLSLNPTRKVGRQIAEAIRIHSPRRSEEDVSRRVHELLDLVGIKEPVRRARLFPHQMSGGMRQRVLIAAALAHEPALLVADEPTSALDVTVQKQILDHIDLLRAELGIAMLLITHDLGVAADRTDRMVVLSEGEIVEQGATREIITIPRSAHTARLLDSVPRIDHGRLRWDDELHVARPGDDAASATAPVVLAGHGLRQSFRASRRSFTVAVDGVDVTVRRGHTLGIVGESGSGKSTLARLLTRLDEPEAGTVELVGEDITALRGEQLRSLRRRLQYVYQNPRASIDPRFTLERTLAEPLRAIRHGSREATSRRVAELLELVGLPRSFSDRLPSEVSGGQLQRVAIARALATEPEVVVLDEPVSALDVSAQAQILSLLVRLQAQLGVTLVFISHDLAVVRQVSDEVVVMHDGRLVEHGSAAEVFSAPRSEYTKALLEAIPGRALSDQQGASVSVAPFSFTRRNEP